MARMIRDYAAGILLYHKRGKDIFFLLGRDHRNKWSDFGGKNEAVDKESIQSTACREFCEETMGVVYDRKAIHSMIDNAPYVKGRSYMNKEYYMYLINAPRMIDYSDEFKRMQAIPMGPMFKEKKGIAWIHIDKIVTNNNDNMRRVFYRTFINNFKQIRRIVNA